MQDLGVAPCAKGSRDEVNLIIGWVRLVLIAGCVQPGFGRDGNGMREALR